MKCGCRAGRTSYCFAETVAFKALVLVLVLVLVLETLSSGETLTLTLSHPMGEGTARDASLNSNAFGSIDAFGSSPSPIGWERVGVRVSRTSKRTRTRTRRRHPQIIRCRYDAKRLKTDRRISY